MWRTASWIGLAGYRQDHRLGMVHLPFVGASGEKRAELEDCPEVHRTLRSPGKEASPDDQRQWNGEQRAADRRRGGRLGIVVRRARLGGTPRRS